MVKKVVDGKKMSMIKNVKHGLVLLLCVIIAFEIGRVVGSRWLPCNQVSEVGVFVKDLPVKEVCFYQEILKDGSLRKPFIEKCDWKGET